MAMEEKITPPLYRWDSILNKDATFCTNAKLNRSVEAGSQDSVEHNFPSEKQTKRSRNSTIIHSSNQSYHTIHSRARKGSSEPNIPHKKILNQRSTKRKSLPAIIGNSNITSDDLKLNFQPKTFKRDESLSHRAARQFDYNDPDLAFNLTPSGPVVIGGTKEKLISLLTTPSFIAVRFTIEFLAVYRYFATCQDLLESLKSAYNQALIPPHINEDERQMYISKVRKRVVLVLIRWMENHPRDFYDANAVMQLADLINQIEDNEDSNRLQCLLKVVEGISNKFDFLTPRVRTDKIKSPLFLYSSTVLAQQLALLDHKQFCEIELFELKGQKWTEEQSFQSVPKLTRCIEFFNRISYWVATEIVSQNTLKLRVKALKKLISIAEKCSEYQNYNTMFAIVSAFSFASISRLKLTWKSLPERYWETVNELNHICGIEEHYLPYKKLLVTKTPPLVPYLGVFLRDLTFIEVGNSTYLEGEGNLINFEKFRMLAAVLEDIRSYQQVPYTFEQNRAVEAAFRYSILTLDPDELYNLSRIVEPSSASQSRKRNGSIVDSSKNIFRSLKQSLS